MNTTMRIGSIGALCFCIQLSGGCLWNIRNDVKANVVINDVSFDDEKSVIRKDGWVEVKRLKITSDRDTSLLSLGFLSALVLRDAFSLQMPSYPVPEWSVLRGALVVDDMLHEIVDYRDRGFAFRKKLQLYANTPATVSLEIRLLPIKDTAWVGFCLTSFSHPDDASVIDTSSCTARDLLFPQESQEKQDEKPLM